MSSEEMQELKNVIREVVAAEVGALRTEMNAKFDKVDARFDEQQRQMDARFEKQQLHIDKRFNVVYEQLHEVRADVLDLHGKFSELQSAVDRYVVRAEHIADEHQATTHAMERYERDFKRLGEATGVKLESAA